MIKSSAKASTTTIKKRKITTYWTYLPRPARCGAALRMKSAKSPLAHYPLSTKMAHNSTSHSLTSLAIANKCLAQHIFTSRCR